MSVKIESQVLENRFVRLEPMSDARREELRAACEADQDIWTRLYPFSWAGEHFEPTWKMLMGDVEAGKTIGMAVVVDDVCVGLSCFSSIDRANASVEIGGTYYHPDVRGGAVNPACKRLMMAHAFASGARLQAARQRIRVVLQRDDPLHRAAVGVEQHNAAFQHARRVGEGGHGQLFSFVDAARAPHADRIPPGAPSRWRTLSI